MTKLIKARKNGKYTDVISLTETVKAGTLCVIREIADPVSTDQKILVISKDPNEPKTALSKGDGIKNHKTPDGRLIMREKVVHARKESSSTVISLTGFIKPNSYYWVRDMGPAIVIKNIPTYDEIQAEMAEINMETED